MEKRAAFPNLLRIGLWNLADFRHRFAGEGFDFEPDLEFSLLGPKLAHRRAGITLNHRANIESGASTAKRFVEKETSLERTNRVSDASGRLK